MNSIKPITVLLIDDQKIVGDAIQGMLSDQSDIHFHFCEDPSKAIQTAEQIQPTVILQDLIMPDIDGLMLVNYFKASHLTKDIPLVVLSSKEDPVVKANSFKMGANDYLVKLPDRIELIARIRYHSEAYLRLLERNLAYKKLEESQKALNAELAEAASYVKSLLPAPMISGDVRAEWKFLPSTQLGGDAFDYRWIDDQHLIFYLLDVCGHGVGAALMSISIMNMLRQPQHHTEHLDPSRVLSSLNASFPMEKNNDMFFTIWYGVYDRSSRHLRYASAGHPPAVLVGEGGKTIKELRCEAPVIGAMPATEFPSGSLTVEKGDKLYLYSDGVYEIAKKDGTMMSLSEFLTVFRLPAEGQRSDVERIIDFSVKAGGKETFVDDVSILELSF